LANVTRRIDLASQVAISFASALSIEGPAAAPAETRRRLSEIPINETNTESTAMANTSSSAPPAGDVNSNQTAGETAGSSDVVSTAEAARLARIETRQRLMTYAKQRPMEGTGTVRSADH
jgi:hypothetical protein